MLLNIGGTAHTGGVWREDPAVSAAVKRFVWNGGGLIGVGEPGGHQYQGRCLQPILGVEKETGFTLGYDKYNWEEHPDHFLLADCAGPVDFGEAKAGICALEGAEVLVRLAVNEYGGGRGVYLSGLPCSFENGRLPHRAILWASHGEKCLDQWFSSNYNGNVEVHAYPESGAFAW